MLMKWPSRMRVLAGFVLFGLAGGGCSSTPPKYVTTFYMESPTGTGVDFVLPGSQIKMHRQAEPFVNATSVLDIQEGQVGVTVDPNQAPIPTPCFLVYFDREGTRDIYTHTVAENYGKRIFMFANDIPLAVFPIDQMVTNGVLFMFPELPGKDANHAKFEELVKDLHESSLRVQELKRRQ